MKTALGVVIALAVLLVSYAIFNAKAPTDLHLPRFSAPTSIDIMEVPSVVGLSFACCEYLTLVGEMRKPLAEILSEAVRFVTLSSDETCAEEQFWNEQLRLQNTYLRRTFPVVFERLFSENFDTSKYACSRRLSLK